MPLCRVGLVQKRDIDHVEEEETNRVELARAWDDITGVELDAREVLRARQKEIQYVHEKQALQFSREVQRNLGNVVNYQ